MEESTEAHMETDVSSTTEDVPETQEVTGSNGSIEMVIVVEKVVEEERNTNIHDGQDSPLVEESFKEVSKSIEEPIPMGTEIQLIGNKSPSKDVVLVQPPSTDPQIKSPQKLVDKNQLLNNEIEVSARLEDADSSITDSVPIPIEKLENINEGSTTEIVPEIIHNEVVENSPKKDIPKAVQMSPNEELLINNSTVVSPIKEPVVVENLITNGVADCTETIPDTPSTNEPIETIIPVDVTIERDTSDDSQLDTLSILTTCSETPEKEHNRSISRELKSLINSAKESKIINECTQVKTKTRKPKLTLDASNTSLNSSFETEKIKGVRRLSNNSQKSNSSEKSEKVALKRSMRSQNPEFVTKVKQFLNSVTGKGQKDYEEDIENMEEKTTKEKGGSKEKHLDKHSSVSPSKMKKMDSPVPIKDGKLRSDNYCWRCHWEVGQTPIPCTVCPRTFHYKCLSTAERNKISDQKNWVCPECMLILQAESSETRSQAMKKTSLGTLCELLKYALERMLVTNGVDVFAQPVDRTMFPDYDKYIVHPMDLSLMRFNIDDGVYGSTVAFLADTHWILHNSIIFNTLQSKLTASARALIRACRNEMSEIEACPECYAAAHARRPTWFTDVCTTPHILLWAKLKGFPFWPAKGMSVNTSGHVDVRFFGAHDRAWVPSRDCFLYSEKDPNNFRTKRQDIIDSMQEAEEHIRNLSRKYGKFVYPAFKTIFNPNRMTEQLKLMIPSFAGEIETGLRDKSNASPAMPKIKSRSRKNSNSVKNNGDVSETDGNETEGFTSGASRKMADGAEIAKEDDTNTENLDLMEVDTTSKINDQSLQTNNNLDSPKNQSKNIDSSLQKSKTSQSPIVKSKRNDSPITKSKSSGDSPFPKSKSSELLSQTNKNSESRKRRRSDLEEAVITIIESSSNSPAPKRRKSENRHDRSKRKSQQEPSSSKEFDKNIADIAMSNGEVTKKDVTPSKDNEPSSSTKTESDKDKNQRVTPIRIALVQKDRHHNLRTSTAKEAMAKILNPTKDKDKEKDSEKTTPKQKHSKTEKGMDKTPKEDKLTKSEKRRNSRHKSFNNTPKLDKPKPLNGKKSESEASTANKDKLKENKTSNDKDTATEKSKRDKTSTHKPNAETGKSVKDRRQFDNDTSITFLARNSQTVIVPINIPGLPTISSVCSLSTLAQNTTPTTTSITTCAKSPDIVIESSSDSSVIATSIDTANAKSKIVNNSDSMVGKVGVRAFARMTSPERTRNKNDAVEIEIKAEPIDVDDADRQVEKMNLMNAFRLQPVNPANTANLREVRINKVLVTPLNAKKTAPKTIEVRPKAKKTFPQNKKVDDGQLHCKNSMVYIPIQPPMTQAPVRPTRVVAGPTCPPPMSKALMSTSVHNSSLVNTVTTPIMQISSICATSSSTVTSSSISMSTLNQVPASVQTVPVMTSVNGQWMFSFQPVMSVGAIERNPQTAQSSPIVNGIPERNTNAPPLVPLSPAQSIQAITVNPGTGHIAITPPTTRISGDTSTPGEPPRLQQRPSPSHQFLGPLDPNTPVRIMPAPSSAGPLTALLEQNAVKLADYFRTILEDSIEKIDDPIAQLTTTKLQMEQMKWKYQSEIQEMKHNQELSLTEMRQVCEKEKLRALSDAKRAAQLELEAAVKAAKAKQWCANCNQEAQFYCCWNTSYCDYPCQRAHWSQHFSVCAQQRQDGCNNSEPPAPTETRLQTQSDNTPKTPAPVLTVGGKVATQRVISQEQNNANSQKSSIIVSMVEDKGGNQTMKCVGTYKSPSTAQNVSPIILNKQIMNSEENANKKVVSTGGYLIVGGNTNSAAVVTPARRTHTIQYYT